MMKEIPPIDEIGMEPLLMLLSVRQVEEMETKAVLAERERCAKIAELVAEHVSGKFDSASAYYIAELIRKGK